MAITSFRILPTFGKFGCKVETFCFLKQIFGEKFFQKWRSKSKKKICPKRSAPLADGLFRGGKNGKKCGTK
jgi:hypothetical protein